MGEGTLQPLSATEELHRRAAQCAQQRHLLVDYYRIRRKVAVPLPVRGPAATHQTLRAFSGDYPWNIWLMWALAERVETLLYSAQHAHGAEGPVSALKEDLRALCEWPSFRETDRPDLPFAHAVQTLWRVAAQGVGLGESLRSQIDAALARAVDDALPSADRILSALDAAPEGTAPADHHAVLHNINLIGCFALATAARYVQHQAAERLDARARRALLALLNARDTGFTEGVSYDGYVMSFALDWLGIQPLALRSTLLAHPRVADFAHQATLLGAPGDVAETAPLGDVEPKQMAFVWSAVARLYAMTHNPTLGAMLARLSPSQLRADALFTVAQVGALPLDSLDSHSPQLVNHAYVMRTGDEPADLAVAIGFSQSPLGHIHFDNGSLTIGTQGHWWVDDPGYQQYLDTSERTFTVGPSAHNAPVVNGMAQKYKRPTLRAMGRSDEDGCVQYVSLDLTTCYPEEAGVHQISRTVWLVDTRHVVVCDALTLKAPGRLGYHWHGHRELFWEGSDGWLALVSEKSTAAALCISSPQFRLEAADVVRLRGSRGQLTVAVALDVPAACCVWWIFSLAHTAPRFALSAEHFDLDGRRVSLAGISKLDITAVGKQQRRPPVAVTAKRTGPVVEAVCEAGLEHFEGEVEFAFYLLANGQRIATQWYEPQPTARFLVPDTHANAALEVRAFVREKARPDRKVAKTTRVEGASG
jgi:hypothetical protein